MKIISYSYKQFFEKRIRFGDSVPIIITLLGDAEARGNKSFPKLFIFMVENYYFKVKVGLPGEIQLFEEEIWNWEIKVAIDNDDQYYGMAIERERNVLIPWKELKEHDYISEIKALCLKRSKYEPKDEW